MKSIRIIMICIISFLISGCAKVVTEYVPQIVVKEVPVPVGVSVPIVECKLNGINENEILNNMLRCIVDQKKVLDILRKESEGG